MKWKQVGDDYELRCDCCKQPIALIRKTEGRYSGIIIIEPYKGGYEGKTFAAVRPLVNKRVQELLKHD